MKNNKSTITDFTATIPKYMHENLQREMKIMELDRDGWRAEAQALPKDRNNAIHPPQNDQASRGRN